MATKSSSSATGRPYSWRSKRGPERRTVVAVANGTVRIVVSAALLTELSDVFGRPHTRAAGIDDTASATILRRLTGRSLISIDHVDLPVRVRDPKDVYLVKSALAVGGAYFVTVDNDLLVLADDLRSHGVEVVTPAQYVEILGEG